MGSLLAGHGTVDDGKRAFANEEKVSSYPYNYSEIWRCIDFYKRDMQDRVNEVFV